MQSHNQHIPSWAMRNQSNTTGMSSPDDPAMAAAIAASMQDSSVVPPASMTMESTTGLSSPDDPVMAAAIAASMQDATTAPPVPMSMHIDDESHPDADELLALKLAQEGWQ